MAAWFFFIERFIIDAGFVGDMDDEENLAEDDEMIYFDDDASDAGYNSLDDEVEVGADDENWDEEGEEEEE